MKKRIISLLMTFTLALSLVFQVSAAELLVPESELPAHCQAHFAYEDMQNSPDPEAWQTFYDRLFKAYSELWTCTENLKPYTFLNNDIFYKIVDYSDLNISDQAASQIYYMFRNDNPLFYYARSLSWSGYGSFYITVEEEYADASARIQIQSQIIDYLISMTDKVDGLTSEYQIAKALHDEMIKSSEYAYVYKNGYRYADTSEVYQTIVGIIRDNKGVCAAYASTYELLMNYFGVDCAYVTGLGNGGDHAWNVAKLDDEKLYAIDVTWDDTAVTTSYFARGSAFFNKTHVPDEVPESEEYYSNSLGFYFVTPQLSVEDYDPSYVKPEVIMGDANSDGVVNMRDYVAMQRYLIGTPKGVNEKALDFDHNGVVNMRDYVKFQRLLLS